ncbi:MAG TPA: hypothetical protein VMM59_00030 [Thermohalobaculum sp.]|nr:hypothetical protein [Thermohalobaculum sp.]
MRALLWPYYAPEEVAAAVEHIDVLVGRGVPPEEAAADAARIYRARLRDFRTPLVAAHLATQWRLKRRGGPGPFPGGRPGAAPGWRPRPGKYGDEVSLRAFLHRLLHE